MLKHQYERFAPGPHACIEFVAADQCIGALRSLRSNPRFAALTTELS